jgi:hypothetical protein
LRRWDRRRRRTMRRRQFRHLSREGLVRLTGRSGAPLGVAPGSCVPGYRPG